ncbi:MAG: undecaprenyl-diphosphate phosphatase [Alistipes sp.]|jgi:undecaprenyl-diphosphatase|nr:undecaprenyl-diphosphate phosphatase [Alistipes sp.]
MDTLQAIILGIIQGLTEFLPVSSSGHLQLANALLGTSLDPEADLTFGLTLHAATVLSTIVVLWREIWLLLRGCFSRTFTEEQAYVLKIVISMIPIAVVGFCFMEFVEQAFSSLLVVGLMLLLTSALLSFAYYAKPREKSNISYRDAFVIGLAQAVAVMPGLSRSGTTIATGLLLGNRKDTVAQFSFLMVLPPILGNALLDVVKGEFGGGVDALPLVAGFFAAFVTGCLACRFMLEIVKRGKLVWFAAYCAVAGALATILYFV